MKLDCGFDCKDAPAHPSQQKRGFFKRNYGLRKSAMQLVPDLTDVLFCGIDASIGRAYVSCPSVVVLFRLCRLYRFVSVSKSKIDFCLLPLALLSQFFLPLLVVGLKIKSYFLLEVLVDFRLKVLVELMSAHWTCLLVFEET